ncbi:NAPDH-dependent diflavin reductase [Bachmanniomyces sp. S44760]|nr:NAPDH-dependent diflavin reductase [Bachmanniomyces sp. S44760]
MDERKVLILYGSETGNAQDVAEELGRTIERLRFATDICPCDAVEPLFLRHYSIVIISISTIGQGDLPTNARKFWKKLLRRKLACDYLQNVRVTTFGLGDSSYPQFNYAARKLHTRLLQLGVQEFCPRGEGDEQHPEGHDATFIPWLINLREKVLDEFPLEGGLLSIPNSEMLQPKLLLAQDGFEDEDEDNDASMNNSKTFADVTSHDSPLEGSAFEVTLTENRRLTSQEHWQDVRHLVFSTTENFCYSPGDVLTIHPQNPIEDVDFLIRLMEWESIANLPVRLVWNPRSSAAGPCLPSSIGTANTRSQYTFRELLMIRFDITAVPRRSFFAQIAHFATDEAQKERLLEFTSPEYIDELYDYTTRPRRGIIEILQEFQSVRIPWQWAATVIPSLRGRQFSISSGGPLKTDRHNSMQFELTVAIVKYRTVIRRLREGVCTRYLANLKPGSRLQVSFQNGSLSIKRSDLKRPVVMVGPGTGVAPMRSLIWERLSALTGLVYHDLSNRHRELNCDSIGEHVLFFGCRNKEQDYLYRHEWDDLQQRMPLKVFTAFSRDQKRKIYVQDLIRQQQSLVYRLLHDLDGLVYVCGSSGKMPQAVREALIDVFQDNAGMGRKYAEMYLRDMETHGRYKQETW